MLFRFTGQVVGGSEVVGDRLWCEAWTTIAWKGSGGPANAAACPAAQPEE